jgi:hypothetical protein
VNDVLYLWFYGKAAGSGTSYNDSISIDADFTDVAASRLDAVGTTLLESDHLDTATSRLDAVGTTLLESDHLDVAAGGLSIIDAISLESEYLNTTVGGLSISDSISVDADATNEEDNILNAAGNVSVPAGATATQAAILSAAGGLTVPGNLANTLAAQLLAGGSITLDVDGDALDSATGVFGTLLNTPIQAAIATVAGQIINDTLSLISDLVTNFFNGNLTEEGLVLDVDFTNLTAVQLQAIGNLLNTVNNSITEAAQAIVSHTQALSTDHTVALLAENIVSSTLALAIGKLLPFVATDSTEGIPEFIRFISEQISKSRFTSEQLSESKFAEDRLTQGELRWNNET